MPTPGLHRALEVRFASSNDGSRGRWGGDEDRKNVGGAAVVGRLFMFPIPLLDQSRPLRAADSPRPFVVADEDRTLREGGNLERHLSL